MVLNVVMSYHLNYMWSSLKDGTSLKEVGVNTFVTNLAHISDDWLKKLSKIT
jgi:hypothetical protein